MSNQPSNQVPQGPSQKPRKLKLSRKEKIFVDEFARTGNGTQSALKAYEIKSDNPENVAGVIALENLRKPKIAKAVEVVQSTLKSALINQGVTPEKVALKVDELLDAQSPIYKNNNATKMVELVGYAPDYNAVDKGLKHATNIFGIEDLSQPKSLNMYNFFFKPELRKEVSDVEEKIKLALIQDAQKT